MEIFRRRLKSLNELDTTKKAERLLASSEIVATENKGSSSNNPSKPASLGSLNPVTPIRSSVNFNPSDPF